MPADVPQERGFDDVMRLVDGVEGWLAEGQARLLYDAARSAPPGGRIVEIGSFRGRSTIVVAAGAPPGVEIVAIDPHAGNDRGPQEISGFADAAASDFEVFRQNLAAAGVAERVRHVRRFSHDAHGEVASPIDVLYVDGAHRYGPARDDIRDWGRRVPPGGALLIHDSFSSLGVTMAILRLLVPGSTFRFVCRSRSMSLYRADLEPRWSARAANAARQCAQLPWFVRNLALKSVIAAGLGPLVGRLVGRRPEWPY